MLKKILISSALLAMATSASASTTTWDFAGGSGTGLQTGSSEHSAEYGLGTGSHMDMTVGGVEMVLTAWSSDMGASKACAANDPGCQAFDDDPFIRRSDLADWGSSGFGGENLDELADDSTPNSPHHAFDSVGNDGGDGRDYDMALIQFSEAVVLEEIDIGWKYGSQDAEFSVLQYNGSDFSSTPFTDDDTWSSILEGNGGDWSFLGHTSTSSTSTNAIVSGATASRFFLIGVYNPIFGAQSGFTNGNDGFKLAGVVTSNSVSVPEPAGALLFATGLFAAMRMRLRRK